MAELTPMMQQYMETKQEYKDCILFYRLGDFYEMFFDDALTASKELEITLTGKNCGLEERAPMCGIPYHAVDGYLTKLVSKGYKVAICEQVEDPKQAKGLVKREVTRIVTPGTNLNVQSLEENQNNFLMSIAYFPNKTGISVADVTTGDYYLTEVDDLRKLLDEINKYMPSEIICNDAFIVSGMDIDDLRSRLKIAVYPLEAHYFDDDACKKCLMRHFHVHVLTGLGIEDFPVGVAAAGALLQYLYDTQKNSLSHFTHLYPYLTSKYMLLDSSTRRNLELTETLREKQKRGSLLWVLDKTKTAMGKRMIRNWLERPLMSVQKITKRQNAIGELSDNPMKRDKIRVALAGINDIERLMTRIAYGTANAKELKALQNTIGRLPEIKAEVAASSSALLKDIESNIDLLTDVEELIKNAIEDEPPFTLREGGMIKKGYNEEIDELKAIMEDGAGVISSIEAKEREATGIPKLKVGYNRVFGYYIEITNPYKDLVPETYIRKQTLTNCERYITQELKELEGKILGAKDRSIALEYEVFCAVREAVGAEVERLHRTAKALAMLDVLASLAEVAVNNNYVCPQINTNGVIDIKDGRHPVVETLLDGAPFVPNDTVLDKDENRCAIITGPNMAGKSTYMRQIALIVLLAQIGSFVPAKSANISIVDAIFTRVGASDDLATGQSTFMVEMNEVSTILKNATSNSLVILDEIGRGTSTFDGMSIARAVLEFVCKKKTLGAKALFATHYHELTAMEGMLDGVKNYSIAVKKRGDDITFLRRIVKGGADESFGIEVAKLAGVPDSVVKRAKVILKELEQNKIDIKFKAEDAVVEEDEDDIQFNFTVNGKNEIIEILKTIDVNTLTPIEAMQTLYDLKKKSEEL